MTEYHCTQVLFERRKRSGRNPWTSTLRWSSLLCPQTNLILKVVRILAPSRILNLLKALWNDILLPKTRSTMSTIQRLEPPVLELPANFGWERGIHPCGWTNKLLRTMVQHAQSKADQSQCQQYPRRNTPITVLTTLTYPPPFYLAASSASLTLANSGL
jgi:hypothetical protein